MHPISASIIARTPKALRRPVEVAIRTVDGAIGDRLPGLAAEIAFYVILSLPALIVAIVAAIPAFLPTIDGQDWQDELVARTLDVASVALTQSTIDSVVEPLLRSLLEGGGVGVVSTAFVAAIWVASRAVKVVLTTTALVYGGGSPRAGWLQRVIGFAVTLGALVVGTILAPLLLAGPAFAERAEEWFGIELGPLVVVWRAAYWPTVVVLAMLAIAALYRIAVPRRDRWWRDLPGAAAATGVWLLGSGGLRVYGAWLTGTDTVYGPLAGPVVALLWLWLTALAVLLGAELNASLTRAGADDADDADDPQISAGGVATDVSEVAPPPHRN
ncbi:MAG: YihY/virulence factor BrkB family protein [Nitriliruptor sp.]|nr:MAG: YihY/virulence factor BrkB family protein [Nitriliruptor sp.]